MKRSSGRLSALDLGLTDRVALVTAASRGLGRATAEALAREGARLVVVARPSNDLDTLGAALGERCRVVAGDLLDPALPQRAVAESERNGLGALMLVDDTITMRPHPRSRIAGTAARISRTAG